MFIIENSTVTVKCRTAIKVLYLFLTVYASVKYGTLRNIQAFGLYRLYQQKCPTLGLFFTFGLSRIMFHSGIALNKFLFISFLTNYARLCLSEILTCPKLAYKTSIHLDFTQCQWYLLSTKSNSKILPNSFAVVAVCL